MRAHGIRVYCLLVLRRGAGFDMDYENITTDSQLQDYCRELATAKSIAFDTEFVSEHTYRPVLCLVQVAAGGRLAVIDALSVNDMDPFWEAILADGHETVVHAGRGEMEFCLQATGRLPAQLSMCRLPPPSWGRSIRPALARWSRRFSACRRPSMKRAPIGSGDLCRSDRSNMPWTTPCICRRFATRSTSNSANSAGWAGWTKKWPTGRRTCTARSCMIVGGEFRATPVWTPAAWPSSASCGSGAMPRRSAAISLPGGCCATISSSSLPGGRRPT